MKFRHFRPGLVNPWRSAPVPESKQELGEEAQKLLDNATLQEAMRRVEEKLLDTWRQSAVSEQDKREAAFALYSGMQLFRHELGLMISDAGMAARERPLST